MLLAGRDTVSKYKGAVAEELMVVCYVDGLCTLVHYVLPCITQRRDA